MINYLVIYVIKLVELLWWQEGLIIPLDIPHVHTNLAFRYNAPLEQNDLQITTKMDSLISLGNSKALLADLYDLCYFILNGLWSFCVICW